MTAQSDFPIRNGYASLEFLLVLFPVILFFVMLLWMAGVAVKQPFAIIAARNDAWDQRFDQKAEPFEMESIEQGRCFGEAERPVQMSYLVDSLVVPRAEHVVFAGTWQSPHVDLNQFPNMDLYKKTATKAGQNKIKEILDVEKGLRNMVEEFDFEAVVQQQIGELVAKGQNFSNRAKSAQSELEQTAKTKLAEAKAALEKNKEYVRGAIEKGKETLSDLKKELEDKADSIKRWEERIGELEKAEEPDEKLIEEYQELIDEAQKRVDIIRDVDYPNAEKAVEQLAKGLENLNQAGGNFAIP